MNSERALTHFASDNEWFSVDETDIERSARDMSMYRIPPQAVAYPRDEADLIALLRLAGEAGVGLIPRGGGTNTGGSAIGRGIIVRFTENGYWDRISAGHGLEVMCGPAVRHDAVQRAFAEGGGMLPSDPSSGPISYIGGNVATRASGPHALKHGAIDRYVTDLTVVLADGSVVSSGGQIPETLVDSVEHVAQPFRRDDDALAIARRKATSKCASGYDLSAILEGLDVGEWFPRLMVGSAGTLGFITQVGLRGVVKDEGEASILLFFRNVRAACDAVPAVLEHDPEAIEIMDPESLSIVVENNPDLGLPEGSNAMLMVELRGSTALERAHGVGSALAHGSFDLTVDPLIRSSDNAQEQRQTEKLWTVRKRLFPTLKRFDRNLRAYSVVNDVGVPVDRLGELVTETATVFRDVGLRAPIYGHAGSGNLHLRPLFDRSSAQISDTVAEVARRVYGIVLDLGGTTTAEHGMGRLRSHYLESEWGTPLYSLMLKIKSAFDPAGILNPEVFHPGGDLLEYAVFD